jgi:acyl-CoA reductase-like NAD-dependent aldehyde dehydrogenase
MPLLLLAAGWAKSLAASLLDHWRIYAVAALLLAYGWHRHTVEQRDDALRALAAATEANQHNSAELRRLTDSLAAAQARAANAAAQATTAAQLLDTNAQSITGEILRHADPSACPAAPSVRAALERLRRHTNDAD